MESEGEKLEPVHQKGEENHGRINLRRYLWHLRPFGLCCRMFGNFRNHFGSGRNRLRCLCNSRCYIFGDYFVIGKGED